MQTSQRQFYCSYLPRGGGVLPEKYPTVTMITHLINWKKTPFAYQTQTVADPFHIQSILPQQPLLHRQNI